MKRLLFVLVGLLIATAAWGQTPVRTWPSTALSTNASSTISSTGVFQSIWTANSISGSSKQRSACTIQNNGANTMYVFFGPIASATTAKSIALAIGQACYCNNGGTVLQDQVSITGTSGDAFYAAQQ